MGMYTEIFVSVRLYKMPEDVFSVLQFLVNGGEMPKELPKHEFFETNRWQHVLTMSSYYFIPRSVNEFFYDEIAAQWFLVSLSNLKNCGSEIEKFFDWLMPFIDASEGEMAGYYRYEEELLPVVVVKQAT